MYRSLLILTIFYFIFILPVFSQVNELKVMSYNVLSSTSISDNVNVIEQSNADVIGLQEGFLKSESIANALGFYHYSNPGWSEAILSRYPITQTNWWGVQIQLSLNQYIYMFNAHLAAYPYQPYDIRDGYVSSANQAISEAESARGLEINECLSEMQFYVQNGETVFLTGDFNEPSHLDWTANAAANGLHFGWEVEWPTSKKCVNLGLNDAYRTYFPDEVLFTGETWTPWFSSDEVYDRIDLVYFSGNDVSVTNVEIIGPDTASTFFITPYESDHRAVLATFNLLPNTHLEEEELFLDVYPNPFSNQISLDFLSENNFDVLIYNSQGKKVREIKGDNNERTIISTSSLSKGVYLLCLQNNNVVLARKRIIKI